MSARGQSAHRCVSSYKVLRVYVRSVRLITENGRPTNGSGSKLWKDGLYNKKRNRFHCGRWSASVTVIAVVSSASFTALSRHGWLASVEKRSGSVCLCVCVCVCACVCVCVFFFFSSSSFCCCYCCLLRSKCTKKQVINC